MHSFQIENVIRQMFSFCYYIGLWHRGDAPTSRELRTKILYSVYPPVLTLSYVVGAIKNKKTNETILLWESSTVCLVLVIKVLFLIWKQKPILELFERICVFPMRDDKDNSVISVNHKRRLRRFSIFVIILVFATVFAAVLTIITSFVEKILLVTSLIFTATIWYMMIHCTIRYEVLGTELTELGRKRRGNVFVMENHSIFLKDLEASIDAHLCLKNAVDEFNSLSIYSNLFFIQIGTSGLCITGSIYCLVFYISNNMMGRVAHILSLFYNTADIFLLTYFGNEVMLSSSRLNHSLFSSDWIEQPQSTKKCVIIFGEYLQQSHVLLVGKLYPLTLETFTRILNSAYSMFNVLQNVAK